jgi:hypothetical protein
VLSNLYFIAISSASTGTDEYGRLLGSQSFVNASTLQEVAKYPFSLLFTDCSYCEQNTIRGCYKIATFSSYRIHPSLAKAKKTRANMGFFPHPSNAPNSVDS